MTSRPWRPGSAYTESTKRSIVLEVYRISGRRGREIAASLNLDRSKVNSFLHDEGKRIYGLRQVSYAWFPPTETTPSPPSRPVVPPSTHPTSVCRALSELPLTQATLKIRSLSIERVDLAFAEDDFSLLDDRIKAELSIRRAELMANNTPEKHAVRYPNIWLIAVLLAIAFAISVAVSNKEQSPGDHLPKPTLNQ
jgi:hypothetical protein